MTEPHRPSLPEQLGGESPSLLQIASTILLHRAVLIRFLLVGVVLTVAAALLRGKVYRSAATLLVATGESPQVAQLRGIASQFGVTASRTTVSEFTPELVVRLLHTPALLRASVLDSLVVPELGPETRSVLDLLQIRVDPDSSSAGQERRIQLGVESLSERISASHDRRTGAISLSLTTRQPSFSKQLVDGLVAHLDRYLQDLGRKRARMERTFIDERIEQQERRFDSVENHLADFLTKNRLYQNSPELVFAYQRLARDVDLQQQVLVSLAQAREQAFIRELQTTPTLTVVEPPLLPVFPEPRRRLLMLVIGIVASAALGLVYVLVASGIRESLVSGDTAALQLRQAILEALPQWVRRRVVG